MSVSDISPASGLNPQRKYFAEVGDDCLNVDACIALARALDTPQAKKICHAFRKRLAECRTTMKGQKPEKIRQEAWFLGLADLGIVVSFTPIKGDMDGSAPMELPLC